MKAFRTFRWLIGQSVKSLWFWGLVLLAAFSGPLLITTAPVNRTTEAASLLPVLSEQATVSHFDTSRQFRSPIGDAPILRFRTSATERDPAIPLSPALSYRTLSSTNSMGAYFLRDRGFDLTRGSLLSLHQAILPIVSAALGVLSLLGRRQRATLQTVAPCGRGMLFGMIAGSLVLELAMVSLAIGLGLGGSLAVVNGATAEAFRFAGSYSVLVFFYALVFTGVGMAIGGLIRSQSAALLIAAASLFGICPLLERVRSVLHGILPQWLLDNPVSAWAVASLLNPPQATFDRAVYGLLQRAAAISGTEAQAASAVHSLADLLPRLGVIAVLWWLVAWGTFPRFDSRVR